MQGASQIKKALNRRQLSPTQQTEAYQKLIKHEQMINKELEGALDSMVQELYSTKQQRDNFEQQLIVSEFSSPCTSQKKNNYDLSAHKNQSNNKKEVRQVTQIDKLLITTKTNLSDLKTATQTLLQNVYYKLRSQIDESQVGLSLEQYEMRFGGSLNSHHDEFLVQDQSTLLTAANSTIQDLTHQITTNSASLDFMIEVVNEQKVKVVESLTQQLNKVQNELQQQQLHKELNNRQIHEFDRFVMETNQKAKLMNHEINELIYSVQQSQDKQSKKVQSCLELLKSQMLMSNIRLQDHAVKDLYDTLNILIDKDKIYESISKIQIFMEQEHNNGSNKSNSPNKNLRVNKSSSSHDFKQRLKQDQLELQQKLRSSLVNYEQQVKQEELQVLEKQIEKQTLLMKQCDQKNVIIISKLFIIVEDSVYRSTTLIDELLKLADSGEAHTLLISTKESIENMFVQIRQLDQLQMNEKDRSIESEFSRQRNRWLISIQELKEKAQQQELSITSKLEVLYYYDRKLSVTANKHLQQIIIGLEIQKNESNENYQIEKKQASYQIDNLEVFLIINQKDEIQNCHKIIQELQVKILEVNKQSELKNKKIDSVGIQISENQKNVEHFELLIQSNNCENEKLQQIISEFQDQDQTQKNLNKSMSQEIKFLKNENEIYKREIEKIECDVRSMKKSRSQLDQIAEKEIKQFKRILEDQKLNFKDQTSKFQEKIDDQKNLFDQKIQGVQQINTELMQIIQEKEKDLNQLYETQDKLEEFSRKQIDLIRDLEQKLFQAYQNNKIISTDQEGSEIHINQLNSKYQQTAQLLKSSSGEVDRLKDELERFIQNFEILQQELEQQQLDNDSLIEKNTQLQKQNNLLVEIEERFNKQSEIVIIIRDEIKNSRNHVESKNQEIKLRESQKKDMESQIDQLSGIINKLQDKIFEDAKISQSGTPEVQQTIAILQNQIYQLEEENIQLRNKFQLIEKRLIVQHASHDNELQLDNQSFKSQIENYQKQILNLKKEVRKLEILLEAERSVYNQEMTDQIKNQISQSNFKNMENIKQFR